MSVRTRAHPQNMREADATMAVCYPSTPVTRWKVEAEETLEAYGPCILVHTVANTRKPDLTEVESEDTEIL